MCAMKIVFKNLMVDNMDLIRQETISWTNVDPEVYATGHH